MGGWGVEALTSPIPLLKEGFPLPATFISANREDAELFLKQFCLSPVVGE